jgi:hypothetical protein
MTEVEKRYSVCEQELLAIVYAVKKFRIHIMCYPVTVYSDNKALSFLRKCTLTSDRATRWVMQLQEYKVFKRKSNKTKGNFRWQPQIGDQVLVKSQPVSDASRGIIGKFQRPYEGPFVIKEVINVHLYKLQSKSGGIKGLFHISHLKPYVKPD